MVSQMLQSRRYPVKNDIYSMSVVLHQIVRSYHLSKDYVQEIDMFRIKGRVYYLQYGRDWLECDLRMDKCSWDILQNDEQRCPSSHEMLHCVRELKYLYVAMSWSTEYCRFVEHMLHSVVEGQQKYEKEEHNDDDDDDDDTDDDGKDNDGEADDAGTDGDGNESDRE